MSDINDSMSKRDLLENMRDVRFELAAARIRISELERNALAPTDLSGVCQVCGETVVRAEHTWEQCATQQAQRSMDQDECSRLVMEHGRAFLAWRDAGDGVGAPVEVATRLVQSKTDLRRLAIRLATRSRDE